jgi:hypothetical protein
MKKFLLAFALLIGIASFNNTAEAQGVNININIGHQPAWGPVGYDYVDYYYMPDINCYFDVNLGLFYYYDRGRWIAARYLPYGYRNYDLYGMYKVVLVNIHDPWLYNQVHYRDYARYRGYRNQIVIRDSRDTRYRDSQNNRIAWYSGNKNNNYRQKEYNSNRQAGRNNQSRINSSSKPSSGRSATRTEATTRSSSERTNARSTSSSERVSRNR